MIVEDITKAKFDKTGYEYAAEIGYEYDQGGRLIKITDGKSKISYKYKTPLKYSIKMDNQKELVCLFDVSNKQSSILFSNKRKSISKRNPSGLVSEIAEYQDDNLLAKKVFEYDQQGLKKLLKTDGFEYAYSYDAVQRVVSVSSQKEGETNTKTLEEFAYDVSDNIVRHTKEGVLADYSYLKGTLLENAGDSVCKYDEAGRIAAILFKNGESYTYIYDEFDRLLSVVKEREGKAADSFDFYYDCFGRRIGQCINQNTTAFVYAGRVLLGEMDENGSIETRYCFDIVSGRPMMFAKEGQYYCYHTDEQMSVCSVTDENGNVVNNYSYDLFGGFKDKKESIFQRLGYTGCEYVPQLGIYNMTFRSYLPDLFRFMTPDPSGVRDSYNPYCYTANNPVNMTDQSGLSGGGQGAGGSTNYDGSKITEQEYTDRKATFRDEVAIFTLVSTSLTTGFVLAIPSASKALGATTVVITGTVAVSASTIVAFVGLAAGIIGTAWWIWPDWNDGIGSSSSSPSRPINYDRPIWGADYIMYHGMPIYK
jgi:RHS repeat-associated core domain